MGTIVKGLFKNKWQSQLQFVRFKSKLNITRPRLPHYERALLETACVPYFLLKKRPPHVPDFESCNTVIRKKKLEDVKEHPLKIILAQESLHRFVNSKLIALFHMNALSTEEKFRYQLSFKKSGMKLVILSRKVLELAFKDTIYKPLLRLYCGPTATAFSPEANIFSLLKICKKMPKLSLMVGIVENRLLSLPELKRFGEFQNIMEARSTLVSVLSSASGNLVQQINHHPSKLMAHLNQHKKLLEHIKN